MAILDRPSAVFMNVDVVRDDLNLFRVLLADEVGENGTDDWGHATEHMLAG